MERICWHCRKAAGAYESSTPSVGDFCSVCGRIYDVWTGPVPENEVKTHGWRQAKGLDLMGRSMGDGDEDEM